MWLYCKNLDFIIPWFSWVNSELHCNNRWSRSFYHGSFLRSLVRSFDCPWMHGPIIRLVVDFDLFGTINSCQAREFHSIVFQSRTQTNKACVTKLLAMETTLWYRDNWWKSRFRNSLELLCQRIAAIIMHNGMRILVNVGLMQVKDETRVTSTSSCNQRIWTACFYGSWYTI